MAAAAVGRRAARTRVTMIGGLAVALAAAWVAAAAVAPAAARTARPPVGGLPSKIGLPDGFFPEGIVAGRYPTFYVASLVTGRVYQGDFSHPSRGRMLAHLPYAKGLSYDAAAHVLYVAGIDGGGYAIDLAARPPSSGAVHLPLPFHPTVGRSSINDVEVVPGVGVFFTDAIAPRLLFVPPWPSRATSFVPLGGFAMDTRPNGTNANGLLHLPGGLGARDGRCPWRKPMLLVGNFALAQLYAVPLPPDGTATRVDVRCGLRAPPGGGDDACTIPGEDDHPPAVMGGVDGMVRLPGAPRHIYIANPTRHTVTVVRLDERCGRRPGAAVVGVLRDARLRTPTTLAAAGGWVWAVNSRLTEVPLGADFGDLASGGFDGWDFDVVRLRPLRAE